VIARQFRLLLERINIPETYIVPWGLGLGGGLVALYLLSFFLAQLMIAALSQDEFNPSDISPPTAAYGAFLGTLLAGILLVQYLGQAAARAQEGQKNAPSLNAWLAFVPSQNTPLYGAMMLGFGVAVLTDALGLFTGLAQDSFPLPLEGLRPSEGLAFIIAALVLILARHVLEETIFRGALYPALLKRMKPVSALFFTSLLFTGLHFLLNPHPWWGLMFPFSLALTTGVARAATKSTLVAMGVHAMFGAFIVLRAVLFA